MKTQTKSLDLPHIGLDREYFEHKSVFIYQSPLILTALLHVDQINVVYLTACASIRLS